MAKMGENPNDKSQIYYILDEVLKSVHRNNQLYESDSKTRQRLEEQVLGIVRTCLAEHDHIFRELPPDQLDEEKFEMKLIGSGKTELDTKKSDLNFSLFFKCFQKRGIRKAMDKAAVMDYLLTSWQNDPSATAKFYNVRLTHDEGDPKCQPRLKFKHIESKLSCDLAIDDNIGARASELMSAYVRIDERVVVLCHSMKLLSRRFKMDLASAADGLSRYTYVVMVIYFLQQTRPPVLPVLHQMYLGQKPVEMVDDCDVWFCQDPPKVASRNAKSSGELWLEMLGWFANEFDCKKYVVSITSLRPVERECQLLAVEDPLDRNNNLCRNLSDSMNTRIFEVFGNSLKRFKTIPSGKWSNNIRDYFFSGVD